MEEREEGGCGARACERQLGGPVGAQIGGPGTPGAPPPEALLTGSVGRGRSPRVAGALAGWEQKPGRDVGSGRRGRGGGAAG